LQRFVLFLQAFRSIANIMLKGLFILACSLQDVTGFAPLIKTRSPSVFQRFVSTEEAPSIVPSHHAERQGEHPVLFLVDVENVRGKTNFRCTHETLLAKAVAMRDPSQLLALVLDHGANATIQVGGPLGQQVAVVFSGISDKADDTIVDLVSASRNMTIVVTSDNELITRCTESAKKSAIDLIFVDPVKYMDQLEGLGSVQELLEAPNPADNVDGSLLIQKEVAARQELQTLDRMLHPRRGNKSSGKGVSRKQRTKLVVRRDKARERLDRVLESSLKNGMPTLKTVIDSGDKEQIESIVSGMESNSKQQIKRGTETTYERQLLAERLRRRLADSGAATSTDFEPITALSKLAAMAKAIVDNPQQNGQRFNNPDVQKCGRTSIDGNDLSSSVLTVARHRSGGDTPSRPLRLLVISDTHGYEFDLLKYVDYTLYGEEESRQNQLPPADVLIHCGDFHGHGGMNKNGLDTFLAAQTHIPTKIVVRGNHDPRMPGSALFPRSRALFVTTPMTMELEGGILLALRPHSKTRTEVLMPLNCDILVSHEPPYGMLDYTYHHQRAGSMPLRTSVESSQTKPALWLCGHIHEGRGAVQHIFSDKAPRPGVKTSATMVVNAANANSGKANSVVNGPIIIDFVEKKEGEEESTAESTWYASPNEGGPMFSDVKLMRPDSLGALLAERGGEVEDSRPRRLLAVDLGLRTGAALFDEDGKLLRLDSCRFVDPEGLEQGLEDLIIKSCVTHVVIEGEDRKLYNIWKNAIEKLPGDVKMARVVADDWRHDFLLKKEQKFAHKAKEAASLIAKQFLAGTDYETVKLSVDAHEAVLIGHYSLRVLGWADLPPVQRYTNGDVVRPKK
jgi:predicted phosphodiesterase